MLVICRLKRMDTPWETTSYNSCRSSIQLMATNMKEIVHYGRMHWKIENECFDCIAGHG